MNFTWPSHNCLANDDELAKGSLEASIFRFLLNLQRYGMVPITSKKATKTYRAEIFEGRPLRASSTTLLRSLNLRTMDCTVAFDKPRALAMAP